MGVFPLLYLFSALVGFAVGPILAAISRRLPLDQPILSTRCPYCDHDLGPGGIVGQPCSACGRGDRGRVWMIVLATAGLFALLAVRFGPTPALLVQSVYFSVFLVLFVIDLQYRWVPDRIVLPAAAFALVGGSLTHGLLNTLAGGAFGFGLLAALFGIGVLVSRRLGLPAEAIGAGDVKLAALIGLAAGWPAVVGGLTIGFFLGGIVALLLVAFRVVQLRSYIPYAPFLLAGGAIVLVDGPRLLSGYLTGG